MFRFYALWLADVGGDEPKTIHLLATREKIPLNIAWNKVTKLLTALLAVRNLYQTFERCYNECVDFRVIDVHIQLHRVIVLKLPFPSPLDREVWLASYTIKVVHTKTIFN